MPAEQPSLPISPLMDEGPYTPLYVRIQGYVRHGIATGLFSPGARLPSENELAAMFSTTRATVAHALEKLAFDRLVVRRAGSGTYVENNLQSLLTVSQAPEATKGEAVGVYEVLSYRPVSGEQENGAYRLERLHLHDGRPLSLETAEVPPLIAAQITTLQLQAMPLHLVLRGLNRRAARQRGSVRVETASNRVSRLLQTPRQVALLIRQYTIEDGEGAPLLSGEITYRADQQLYYEIHG